MPLVGFHYPSVGAVMGVGPMQPGRQEARAEAPQMCILEAGMTHWAGLMLIVHIIKRLAAT